MVIISRTRKDSCNNARMLLLLIDSHGVQSGAANACCKLGQSRAKPQYISLIRITDSIHLPNPKFNPDSNPGFLPVPVLTVLI